VCSIASFCFSNKNEGISAAGRGNAVIGVAASKFITAQPLDDYCYFKMSNALLIYAQVFLDILNVSSSFGKKFPLNNNPFPFRRDF
jgi:hypothetical protein